jgi:hypothetical protein
MTFIMVFEKLQFIDTDETNYKQLKVYGEDYIVLEPLLDNFHPRIGGKSGATISRKREGIINTLNDLEIKVKDYAKAEKLSFKDTLALFFEDKKSIRLSEKYKKDIDWTMLEILLPV